MRPDNIIVFRKVFLTSSNPKSKIFPRVKSFQFLTLWKVAMRRFTSLAASVLLGGIAYLGLASASARAADHGDAPNVDNDSGADIADVFAFLDPNDNTRVIIIGTVARLHRARRGRQLRLV